VQSEGSQDQIGHLEEVGVLIGRKIGNCIKAKGIIGGMALRRQRCAKGKARNLVEL